MPDLLLELFSEEIPARMQGKAAEDLKRLVVDGLSAQGLKCANAQAFATPRRLALLVDGVLYTTGSWSVVFAVDARTGKEKWRWDPWVNQAATRPAICCGVVNRGLALYKGLIAAGVLSIPGLFLATLFTVGLGDVGKVNGEPINGFALFICGVIGLVVTGAIVYITEYYTATGKRPVVSIAQASVTGHGTNVIQGLAVSLEATALPALVIIAGILISYTRAGLFGIAIAVTTMLALAGMVMVGALITNKSPFKITQVTPIAGLTGEFEALVKRLMAFDAVAKAR